MNHRRAVSIYPPRLNPIAEQNLYTLDSDAPIQYCGRVSTSLGVGHRGCCSSAALKGMRQRFTGIWSISEASVERLARFCSSSGLPWQCNCYPQYDRSGCFVVSQPRTADRSRTAVRKAGGTTESGLCVSAVKCGCRKVFAVSLACGFRGDAKPSVRTTRESQHHTHFLDWHTARRSLHDIRVDA
jgi:hypothetical protein